LLFDGFFHCAHDDVIAIDVPLWQDFGQPGTICHNARRLLWLHRPEA
jgi:hypothetical protein